MGGPGVCDEKRIGARLAVRGVIPLIAKCAMSGAPGTRLKRGIIGTWHRISAKHCLSTLTK